METKQMIRTAGLILISACILWIPSNSWPENSKYPVYNPKGMQARYESWLKAYSREYKSRDEWLMRFGIYQSNVQFIQYVNSQNLSFRLTDNQFADLTNEEFKSRYLGLNLPVISNVSQGDEDLSDLPKSIDWRKKGAVTPVKDQGSCASCWAFSAVAAVEGINKIKTGKLISLSEQELVDCDVQSGNQGCNGGLMEPAFEFIKKHGGLANESDYPYVGTENTCNKAKMENHVVSIDGYKRVPPNEESSLQAAVSRQPVSVAVDGASIVFQLYGGGILSGFCLTELNHAVTAVGYGQKESHKYWLIKNSWGKEWGESGYARLERGSSDKRGTCGIAMDASYPIKNES